MNIGPPNYRSSGAPGLVHKYFKRKMIFFVLLANMECCYQSVKILEEMMHSKYQRATPEFPVSFILRCLKIHNCVNELISCNSEHVHKLNTQLNTKTKRKAIMHL